MIDAMGLYIRCLAVSVRGQLQYRASFLMQAGGEFWTNTIYFFALWALFSRFGSLGGWTLPEVALLYGLVNAEWAITDAIGSGFDAFGDLVKTGDFDRVLLRPRSTTLQLASKELTIRRAGRLSQSIVVLLWSVTSLQVTWTLGKIALLAFAVAGGVCLFYGLLVLQATLCFWTVESLEIMNVFTYGGAETAQYPLSIYPRSFRRFFTVVVPLACVTYFPAIALLDRTDPLGTSLAVQRLAPIAGVLFLVLAVQVWKLGVRHYQSTGS